MTKIGGDGDSVFLGGSPRYSNEIEKQENSETEKENKRITRSRDQG